MTKQQITEVFAITVVYLMVEMTSGFHAAINKSTHAWNLARSEKTARSAIFFQSKSKNRGLFSSAHSTNVSGDIGGDSGGDSTNASIVRLPPKADSPLGFTLDQLSVKLHGKGRAQLSWDCLRLGIDPLLFFNPDYPEDQLDNALFVDENIDRISTAKITQRENIKQQYFPAKRKTQFMGGKALTALSDIYPSPLGIESSVATLSSVTTASDGTTKLLLKLSNNNDQEHFIETVIIPHPDWGKSTLCVSSQVGCAQGCVFCATGKMGRLASLSADQILIQLYYANKIIRLDESGVLPKIDNIVFMGMGDAADNIESVTQAVGVMTDRNCFGLARSKITISTVGPSPGVFGDLADSNAVLAWSVHAARDDLRKKLVPTTKYTMEELRDGLVSALVGRSKRLRKVMLEVTLMDGINDGVREAEEMAEFVMGIVERVEGVKVMINLIPVNDIGYDQYRRPKDENIMKYQKVLVDRGVKTFVRTTRGDDEGAACGQLVTKKKRSMEKEGLAETKV